MSEETLSASELQRLVLVRAVANDEPLLLINEGLMLVAPDMAIRIVG